MNKCDAAAFLGCGQKTLYNWLRASGMEYQRKGREYDLSEEQVLALAAQHGWERDRYRQRPAARMISLGMPVAAPAVPSAAAFDTLLELVRELKIELNQLRQEHNEELDRLRSDYERLYQWAADEVSMLQKTLHRHTSHHFDPGIADRFIETVKAVLRGYRQDIDQHDDFIACLRPDWTFDPDRQDMAAGLIAEARRRVDHRPKPRRRAGKA